MVDHVDFEFEEFWADQARICGFVEGQVIRVGFFQAEFHWADLTLEFFGGLMSCFQTLGILRFSIYLIRRDPKTILLSGVFIGVIHINLPVLEAKLAFKAKIRIQFMSTTVLKQVALCFESLGTHVAIKVSNVAMLVHVVVQLVLSREFHFADRTREIFGLKFCDFSIMDYGLEWIYSIFTLLWTALLCLPKRLELLKGFEQNSQITTISINRYLIKIEKKKSREKTVYLHHIELKKNLGVVC